MADETGTVIANRYELSEVIGRGSQGMVWKAIDIETRKPVAVKMLIGPTARDKEFVERLRREQTVMRALSGTCAVGVFDFCTSPAGLPCLVMELLEGTDFEHHLRALAQRDERMRLDALIDLLEPVVVALERAHAANIVHRDLKPANVFLQNAAGGQAVRLLDFGLARVRTAQPLTAVGTIIGSPAYMAPEVWKGQPDLVDSRADVYSLGVLVFRALAGKVPFDAPTLPAQLVLVTTAERPSLCAIRKDLPRSIDAWVARGLAIDPASRFADVRVLWDALRLCAAPKKRGLLGLNPLTSALKAARSVVERIAGRSAAADMPLASPQTPVNPPRDAGAPEPPPPAPDRVDAAAQAGPTVASETALAPTSLPERRSPRRGRSMPHLPPPPPPRRAPPSADAKTRLDAPPSRTEARQASARTKAPQSSSDPSDAKTQLWIRPPKVPASDPHTHPTVVAADPVSAEALAAAEVSERADVGVADAPRRTAATKAQTSKKKTKKKNAADPAVKKTKPKRASATKTEANGASRKKSSKRTSDAPNRKKPKKTR